MGFRFPHPSENIVDALKGEDGRLVAQLMNENNRAVEDHLAGGGGSTTYGVIYDSIDADGSLHDFGGELTNGMAVGPAFIMLNVAADSAATRALITFPGAGLGPNVVLLVDGQGSGGTTYLNPINVPPGTEFGPIQIGADDATSGTIEAILFYPLPS